MPEIDLNGKRTKVACGPCIRGHRSSKCTHKDRVLIEVRKPGRPLSACPHPAGSCNCERAVITYTVPKSSGCGCGPVQNEAASNRVQKGRGRKQSSSITPSTVERALDGDPNALAQTVNGVTVESTADEQPKASCCGEGSTAAGQPQKPNGSNGSSNPDSTIATPQPKQEEQPRMRLGMFGVGGYRARDEIGWNEQYPDMNNTPWEHDGVSRHLTKNPSEQITIKRESHIPDKGPCCGGEPSLANQSNEDAHNSAQVNGTNDRRPQQAFDFPASRFSFRGSVAPRMSSDPSQPQIAQTFENHRSSNGQAFSQVSQAFIPTSQGLQISDLGMTELMHNCTCGDGCACFACSTHPNNKTTLDYVRYHVFNDVTSTPLHPIYTGQPGPVLPQSNVQAPHAGIIQASNGFKAIEQDGQWFFGSTPQLSHMPNGTSNWPSVETPTHELAQLHLAPQNQNGTAVSSARSHINGTGSTINGTLGTHMPVTPAYDYRAAEFMAQFDHDSPPNSDETPGTLSPSSVTIQEYTLPGCDDPTGTCQCGDGCLCDGCLTHSGHHIPPPPPQPTFTGYADHGSGCACPHPNIIQPSQGMQSPAQFARSQSFGSGFTTPSISSPPPHAGLSTPAPMFTHVHGPTCACPGGTVVQAQARLQAHAEMHGPNCQCPVGEQYLQEHVQAEARAQSQLHSQVHGPNCACPGIGNVAGGGWIGGPGG